MAKRAKPCPKSGKLCCCLKTMLQVRRRKTKRGQRNNSFKLRVKNRKVQSILNSSEFVRRPIEIILRTTNDLNDSIHELKHSGLPRDAIHFSIIDLKKEIAKNNKELEEYVKTLQKGIEDIRDARDSRYARFLMKGLKEKDAISLVEAIPDESDIEVPSPRTVSSDKPSEVSISSRSVSQPSYVSENEYEAVRAELLARLQSIESMVKNKNLSKSQGELLSHDISKLLNQIKRKERNIFSKISLSDIDNEIQKALNDVKHTIGGRELNPQNIRNAKVDDLKFFLREMGAIGYSQLNKARLIDRVMTVYDNYYGERAKPSETPSEFELRERLDKERRALSDVSVPESERAEIKKQRESDKEELIKKLDPAQPPPPPPAEPAPSETPPSSEGDIVGSGVRKNVMDERGLSDAEINKIMGKYPEYMGTIAHNEFDSVIKNVKEKSRGGCIINTDPASKAGCHWQAIFWDSRPEGSQSVEFFDSFGDEMDSKLRRQIAHLAKRLKAGTYLKLKENGLHLQDSRTNNCGFFCVKFLMDRFRGKAFNEATGWASREGEQEIQKFKKKFGYVNSF